jgi:hypothetical protein
MTAPLAVRRRFRGPALGGAEEASPRHLQRARTGASSQADAPLERAALEPATSCLQRSAEGDVEEPGKPDNSGDSEDSGAETISRICEELTGVGTGAQAARSPLRRAVLGAPLGESLAGRIGRSTGTGSSTGSGSPGTFPNGFAGGLVRDGGGERVSVAEADRACRVRVRCDRGL